MRHIEKYPGWRTGNSVCIGIKFCEFRCLFTEVSFQDSALRPKDHLVTRIKINATSRFMSANEFLYYEKSLLCTQRRSGLCNEDVMILCVVWASRVSQDALINDWISDGMIITREGKPRRWIRSRATSFTANSHMKSQPLPQDRTRKRTVSSQLLTTWTVVSICDSRTLSRNASLILVSTKTLHSVLKQHLSTPSLRRLLTCRCVVSAHIISHFHVIPKYTVLYPRFQALVEC